MTFETLDWVAEPERIMLAFEVQGDCEFIGSDYETMRLRQNNLTHIELKGHDDLFLYCSYHQQYGRHFRILRETEDELTMVTIINIEWDGQVSPTMHEQVFGYPNILAKGLFYLDLLTPEAEAELHISISAHQKLEWMEEYQRRLGE